MIERILVATDGSDSARHAEKTACELAVALGANLVIAHTVVERPSEEEVGGMAEVMHGIGPQPFAPLHMDNLVEQVAHATGSERIHTQADAVRALAERLLQRAVERAGEAGVANVETRQLDGDPAESIVEAARREQADLIVVGTRGIGGLRGRLMGSVSEQVMHHADVSTLIARE